jgi:two-component system cell cycle sensor histidine kinase/response regulator CckA
LQIFITRVKIVAGIYKMGEKAQRESSEFLQESEEKYRTLIDNINIGIYRSTPGPEGRYIEINPAMFKMFAYSSKKEFLAMHPVDIYQFPEDRDRFSQKVLHSGVVRNLELNLKKKDGTPLICSTTAMAVRDSDGNVKYIDGIVENISERKKTEQALSESRHQLENRVKERTIELQRINLEMQQEIIERKKVEQALRKSETTYRSLFENMIEGLFQTRPDGKIMAANPALVKMLGYDSEADLYNSINVPELYQNPEDRKLLIEKLEKDGEVRNAVIGLRCKDGSEIIVRENARIVRDEKGNILHFEGLLTDITDQKRAEEEHQKLQAQAQYTQKIKSLEILAAGIAHDFNNLLMGIMGNASLALGKIAKDSPIRYYLEKIEKSVEQAAELTRQMLAYSGKGKFNLEELDVSTLIENMTPLLKSSISKKVSLIFNLEKKLPRIVADLSQIRQVFLNLVVNASEAIGDRSGTILIKTDVINANNMDFSELYLDSESAEERYVVVDISDSGPGMSEQTKSKIFDPFFTTKFIGRGLGLAVVLGIVRGHKGMIKVFTEPGSGTTFKVFFPVIKKMTKMKNEEKSIEKEKTVARKTLLVVDDEEIVLEVASSMLESAGFNVLNASDGQECIEIFQRHQDEILLVLLDATMPNMNGEEAFRELKRLQSDVKVILTSGYSEQDATHHFFNEGLAGFIQKPYSLNQLILKVNEVLKDHS